MKYFLLVFCLFFLISCKNIELLLDMADKIGSQPKTVAPKATSTIPKTNNQPIDLSKVKWLHANVSEWPQTGTLISVDISNSIIKLIYDKANTWPAKVIFNTQLNANPWIFVKQNNVWYAGTFEWFRKGQTSKSIKVVKGDHIKVKPLHNFIPKSGETYGFMVSGLARTSTRNVKERTNILMKVWP